jgi:hypothetical protein
LPRKGARLTPIVFPGQDLAGIQKSRPGGKQVIPIPAGQIGKAGRAQYFDRFCGNCFRFRLFFFRWERSTGSKKKSRKKDKASQADGNH